MINLLKSLFGLAHTPRPVERIPLPQKKTEKEAFIKRYLDTLIKHGWVLEPSTSDHSTEKARYQMEESLAILDPDLLNFLCSFNKLENGSKDAWFIELDMQAYSLSSWKNYMTIMESRIIEDSTISVILQGENKGKFIYCNEGIYEDTEIIADDFFSLLQLHAYCVELGKETYKNNKLWAFI
jgi:hypothetical protein